MSITMSRPDLPSIQSAPGDIHQISKLNERSLPPLSALLNNDDDKVNKDQNVVSPIRSNSEVGLQQTPVIKTPIRLPSFDSINFNQNSVPLNQQPHMSSIPLNSIPTPTSQQYIPPPNQPQFYQTPMGGANNNTLVSPLIEKKSYAFISHSPSTFPLQEPSIDNHQLARRKRRRTSPIELSILQNEFEKGSTPNRTRRLDIAKKVNMTEKAIQIWFQNRRQTLRRQSNAEREIHHIEPIYMPHLQHQDTPIRQSMNKNMVYQTPISIPEQGHHQYLSHSSPMNNSQLNQSSPSSSPIQQQPQQQIPQVQVQPVQQQSVQQVPQSQQTPAKTPSCPISSSSSPTKETTSPTGSTYTFRLNKPSPSRQPLKQISNNFKIKSKPVMKVNPLNSSSTQNSPQRDLKKRKVDNKEDVVENLLNLRNWK